MSRHVSKYLECSLVTLVLKPDQHVHWPSKIQFSAPDRFPHERVESSGHRTKVGSCMLPLNRSIFEAGDEVKPYKCEA